MINYKLSICIPTYNRAQYLPELLDSIINQVDLNVPVEICISDNASTDNTETLVTEYQKKYSHIKYVRQPENMGADKNYLKVVEIATGEYCWLMGSDDALIDDAVNSALNHLTPERDIIIAERIVCNINLTPLYNQKWLAKTHTNTLFNLNNTDSFIDYSHRAKNIGAIFSYISCLIFSRQKWCKTINSNIHEIDKIYGSAYVHAYVLLQFTQTERCNLLYISKPLVLCRSFNDSFLDGDIAKRLILDLNGYELLAKTVFLTSPIKHQCTLWILEKSINELISIKSNIFRKLFSAPFNYYFFIQYYQHLFGKKKKLLFLLTTVMTYEPHIRYIIKKLATYLYHKKST